MAKILFLTSRLPYPLSQGGALRVFNLCRELSSNHECYLACMYRGESDSLSELEQQQVFKSIQLLPAPPRCNSLKRYFRLSESNFNRLGRPAYYQKVIYQLHELVVHNNVDVVVAVTLKMAEFIDTLSGVKKVIDDYDCVTLTLERHAAVHKIKQSLASRLISVLKLARIRIQESKLTTKYDLITTISPVDLATLRELNKLNSDKINLIPNGVSLPLLDSSDAEEYSNSIAFWGNLSFPPNKEAVRYFYSEIYRPYLEQEGVHWYIIGKNADAEIQDMAKTCDYIHITGFVEDLYALVRRIPVMINPIIMGSGLKNKVLEALILSRAVVSTSMGVEALNIQNGIHYVCADTPASFGKEILELLQDHNRRERLGQQGYAQIKKQYSWKSVGNELSRLISELVEQHNEF